MANTGLGKGLAVRHDFRRDIQTLYQRENMRAQIQEEKRRKAQLYGSMLKKGHVRGEYNTRRLEEHYDQLNGKLSDFVTENPGWETDPGLFAKFVEISDGYLQNDIIQEDVQVQQQFEALQQKVNSGTMGTDEINRQMDVYHNYIENGGDPYVFVNPREHDPIDLVTQTASTIGTVQEEVFYKAKNGLTQSRMETRPNLAAVQPAVNALFADEDKRRVMEKMYQDAGGKEVADSAKLYATELVNGTFKFANSQMHYDQYELRMATKNASAAAAGGAQATSQVYNHVWAPYEEAMLNRQNIGLEDLQPNGANATLTPWGKIGEVQNITAADQYKLIDENGKPVDFNYSARTELTGVGSFTTSNFNPFVESSVRIYIPREDYDASVSSAKTDSNMLNILKANGFSVVKEDDFSIFGSGKIPTNEVILQGKMLAPAILNSMTYTAFDKSILGQATSTDLVQSGLYGAAMSEVDVIQAKIEGVNRVHPNKKFSLMPDGRVLSLDGKHRYDPETQGIYEIL